MAARLDGRAAGAATLWRSFGHAWDGLVDAALGQRNMRIHLVAGTLAGSFAALAPLGAAERALIVLCTALVIGAESANTALEALVDLHGRAPSEAGRIAKDAAAGAVLALAVASVLVFGFIAVRGWDALAAAGRALLWPALVGAGLAAVVAALVARRRPGRVGTPFLTVAGVGLTALLAATAACPGCAVVPMLLLAIAAAAARRQMGRGDPSQGVDRVPRTM